LPGLEFADHGGDFGTSCLAQCAQQQDVARGLADRSDATRAQRSSTHNGTPAAEFRDRPPGAWHFGSAKAVAKSRPTVCWHPIARRP
jgi:hypothetical protein